MKKPQIIAILMAALAGMAQASTITWNNGGSRGHAIFLSDGVTRVSEGSLVEVGFYSTIGDAASVFTQFGTTSIGNPGTGVGFVIGGHIPASGKNVVSTLSDGNTTYAGKQFVLRIYNAVTAAAATEMGIFTSASWTTPAGTGFDDISDSFGITLGLASPGGTVGAIALDPPGETAAGSYAVGSLTITTGTNAGASIYKLAAVPEPSVTALFGLLGLVGLRRKR